MNNNILIKKSDELAHLVYKITKGFPKEEIYGLVSQIRMAAVSVPVNIIEGFARQGDKSYRQFLIISYGSLKELKYSLQFSLEEELLSKEDYNKAFESAEECAKILWKTIQTVSKKC